MFRFCFCFECHSSLNNPLDHCLGISINRMGLPFCQVLYHYLWALDCFKVPLTFDLQVWNAFLLPVLPFVLKKDIVLEGL